MTTRLRLAHDSPVAHVVWESDDGLHRIGREFLSSLQAIVAELAGRNDLKAVVLTGSGNRVFSAGADLHEVAKIPDARAAEEFSALGQKLTAAVAGLQVPTVALLNGPAYGGGIELSLACDFRLAAPHTLFRYQAGEWGLLPGWGGTQRLPGLIGLPRARRMMLTGYPVSANEALNWGLIDEILDPADPQQALNAWLSALCSQQVQSTNQLKRAFASTQVFNFAEERAAFAACFSDGTTQARIRAWLESRSEHPRRSAVSPPVPERTSPGAKADPAGTSFPAGATHG
jgi:enoyl-CoA hydratase